MMNKWKKEELRVGKATMFAVTVPVVIDFDEYSDPDPGTGEIGVRVVLLQVGDHWLVITETICDGEMINDYACFVSRDDALAYLNLLGFEVEEISFD